MKVPIIKHRTFNALVDKIMRHRLLGVTVSGPNFIHPWNVSLRWHSDEKEEVDFKKGEWRLTINPGFVNGVDPEIDTIANLATERTKLRYASEDREMPEGKDNVTARLTELPVMVIPKTLPRVLGKGADPIDVGVSESGNLSVSYEPVPSFFSQFNVEGATKLVGNLNVGIQEVQEEALDNPRRLRAFDIALYKDRPAFKIDTSQRGVAGLDGFTMLLSYTYGRGSAANPRPYLRILSKYVPPIAGAASLLDGATDPEYDSILVARVYFLSPVDAPADEELHGEWTPFVEHNLFWNLAHATQKMVPIATSKPITISTGLAAGLGDMIGNQILAPGNDAYAAALVQMSARSLEGSFWSI